MISIETKQQINNWIKKYPEEYKGSAVMEALRLVQLENNNYLTPALIKEVAVFLGIPNIKVNEVATFYENYNHQLQGKNIIRFCHNISCMLKGGDNLISYLENKLDITNGEVTRDGRFSLKKVECLGACINAPVLQIGDKYYENLNKDELDKILEGL